MRTDELDRAAERLRGAILASEGLPEALGELAQAARAVGALIIGDRDDQPCRIIESSAIRDPVARYLAGDRPPDPRRRRVVVGPWTGFAVDLDHFSPQEIARDPYYQEFLRPHGVQWHACAWIGGDDASEICLSLKRSPAQGRFTAAEARRLDALLGGLRTSIAVRQASADLRAEAAGVALEGGDRGLAWFDGSGRLAMANAAFEHLIAPVATLRQGRLVARLPEDGAELDRVIGRACARPGEVGLKVLRHGEGERILLRILPIAAVLEDFFLRHAAVAVASPLRGCAEPPSGMAETAMRAFGLTHTEARLAALMACGWTLAAAAARLHIGVGTGRNHLKAVFAKTGVSRQVELAVLLAQLWT